MIKIKKTILIAVFLLLINSLLLKAQDATGIRFEQSLKWSETLAKAKQEHKFIFVDCYATWCGPCKWMDANVYPKKEIGDVFNRQFISVRVQMDKTSTDDSLTKARYSRAEMFADDYHVNAYPTFLFFDPDGKPVHKVSGSLDEKQFIQLAKDAQDPNKQYYQILKSFRPGKLDTAEEKGLAWGLINSDKQLAGKLAADYLRRIPQRQLGDIDNLKIMIAFREALPIQQETAIYLTSLPKDKLGQGNNELFISQLRDMPQVKAIVLSYLYGLNKKEMRKQENIDLMAVYDDDPGLQSMIKSYIENSSDKQLLNKQTLYLVADLTRNTGDKGFTFFYTHTRQIDSLTGKDWAEGKIRQVISQTYWQPEFDRAKQSGDTPDFSNLTQTIENKFTKAYADRIIADANVDWYSYEVNNKKQDNKWPEYTQAMIDRNQRLLAGGVSIKDRGDDINNTCYTNIFLHSDDTTQLNIAVRWMKDLVGDSADADPDELDTYACVLYKAGKTADALAMEQRVLQFCIIHKALGTQIRTNHTVLAIERMKKGEEIWNEKEFQ